MYNGECLNSMKLVKISVKLIYYTSVIHLSKRDIDKVMHISINLMKNISFITQLIYNKQITQRSFM